MIKVILLWTIIAATIQNGEALVRQYLSDTNDSIAATEDLIISRIPQVHFDKTDFYAINTGKVYAHPCPELSRIVAVTNEGKIFPIFGFNTCEYNEAIKGDTLDLQPEEVLQYAISYLNATRVKDLWDHYYISSVEEFIGLNRSLMHEPRLFDDSLLGIQPEVIWDEKQKPLRDLCQDLNFNTVVYDSSAQVYDVGVYVWMLSDGAFRHLELTVSRQGQCEIVKDSVLAAEVGCWADMKY